MVTVKSLVCAFKQDPQHQHFMKRDTSGKTVTLRMQNHKTFVANGKLHGENVQFKGKCNFFDVLELSGWFIMGGGGRERERERERESHRNGHFCNQKRVLL